MKNNDATILPSDQTSAIQKETRIDDVTPVKTVEVEGAVQRHPEIKEDQPPTSVEEEIVEPTVVEKITESVKLAKYEFVPKGVLSGTIKEHVLQQK